MGKDESDEITAKEWHETLSRLWYVTIAILLAGTVGALLSGDDYGLYAPVAAFLTAVTAISKAIGFGKGVLTDWFITALILAGTVISATLWLLAEIQTRPGSGPILADTISRWYSWGIGGYILGTPGALYILWQRKRRKERGMGGNYPSSIGHWLLIGTYTVLASVALLVVIILS